MVFVRDPSEQHPEGFFFTTDLTATAVAVLEPYDGRWTIEETFRAVKQQLRAETPQSWAQFGPELTAILVDLRIGVALVSIHQRGPSRVQKTAVVPKKACALIHRCHRDSKDRPVGRPNVGETASSPISSKITPEIIRISSEAG